MALVADLVSWLAHDDAGATHERLDRSETLYQRRRSARSKTALRRPQAPRKRGAAMAPEDAEAVAQMEARRESRIFQAQHVIGTPDFDASGVEAGRIADLSIDRQTGRVVCALIGIDGGLGFLKRMYPAPWELLRYDATKGDYVAPADWDDLAHGLALTPEELQSLGAGDNAWRERLAIYYSPDLTLRFIWPPSAPRTAGARRAAWPCGSCPHIGVRPDDPGSG